MNPPRAVTFDAGQTLVELDPEFLARRLAERGEVVAAAAIEAALPDAWRAFDVAVAHGGHAMPWRVLIGETLRVAGTTASRVEALVDWLWSEQPRANLWRRSIAGMRGLCDELRAAGVRTAVISNSEGRLEALLVELGWADAFEVIADSGVLGVEKPARGIFDWTFERLGVSAAEVVHVGDAWHADVLGAAALGARAIWFGRVDDRPRPAGVATAADAAAVRAALVGWGVPLPPRG